MSRTLLSATIGVPIALFAMSLLFIMEMFNVTGRPRPSLVRSSAVLIIMVLLGIVAARFVQYA